MSIDDSVKEAWQQIKTQRDELRLQMHLAKEDLKDELEKLEPEFHKAEKHYKQFKDEAEDTADDVKQTFGVISDELSSAYRRIRDRLKQD